MGMQHFFGRGQQYKCNPVFVSMDGNISLDVTALGGKLPTQTQVLLL